MEPNIELGSFQPDAHAAEVLIRNVGPIRFAHFNLRPLTLLVGQNGVGKTIASTLIYTLHKSIWLTCETRRYDMYGAALKALDAEHIQGGLDEKQFPLQKAQKEILRVLKSKRFADDLQEVFIGELLGTLGNAEAFIRHGSNKAEFSFEHKLGWHFRMEATKRSTKQEFTIGDNVARSLPELKYPRSPRRLHASKVASTVLEATLGPWSRAPIMVPAGRAGIFDAYAYLAQHVLLRRHGLSEGNINGIMVDFIANLVAALRPLDVPTPWKETRLQAFKRMSERFSPLLGGDLKRPEKGGEMFAFSINDRLIEKQLMSSMVKELGPMVAVLGQTSWPQRTFIIDEPECHVHPFAQIELAKVLLSLVQEGFGLIVSTHSPYLAEAINHHWAKSNKSIGGAQRAFNVVTFLMQKGGVVATDAPCDPKFGYRFSEFVDAALEVNSLLGDLSEDT